MTTIACRLEVPMAPSPRTKKTSAYSFESTVVGANLLDSPQADARKLPLSAAIVVLTSVRIIEVKIIFPKMGVSINGVSPNGWFIMKNRTIPLKWRIWG